MVTDEAVERKASELWGQGVEIAGWTWGRLAAERPTLADNYRAWARGKLEAAARAGETNG